MQLRIILIYSFLMSFGFAFAQDTGQISSENLCALEPASFNLTGVDPLPDSLFWSVDGVENVITSNTGINITVNEVRDITIGVRWIEEGVADTLSRTFRIEECICELGMPNVFTPPNTADMSFRPSGDLNQSFGAGYNMHCRDESINLNRFEMSQLLIYDRWGKMVYDSCESEEGNTCMITDRWDGTCKELDVPSDTYVYIFQYKLRNIPGSSIQHEVEIQRGEVLLLR